MCHIIADVIKDSSQNLQLTCASINHDNEVHKLIQALLDGTVTNQPQAQVLVDARFHSPNDAVVAELA